MPRRFHLRPGCLIGAAAFLLTAALPGRADAQDGKLRIVTSLTTYASIAREIVGERGEVTSIARGDENPHFVQPHRLGRRKAGWRTSPGRPGRD